MKIFSFKGLISNKRGEEIKIYLSPMKFILNIAYEINNNKNEIKDDLFWVRNKVIIEKRKKIIVFKFFIPIKAIKQMQYKAKTAKKPGLIIGKVE